MSKSYFHEQTVTSDVWVVNHNFNGTPMLDVAIDINGGQQKVLVDNVKQLDTNTLEIRFTVPRSGTVTATSIGRNPATVFDIQTVPSIPSWVDANAVFYFEANGILGTLPPELSANAVYSNDFPVFGPGASSIKLTSGAAAYVVPGGGFAIDETKSWTIEARVLQTSNTTVLALFTRVTSLTNRLHISTDNGNLGIWNNGNNPIVTVAGAFPINTLVHVSINYDKLNSVITVYLDGTLASTTNVTITYGLTDLIEKMGVFAGPAGYIDRFQITQTVLRTGNFNAYP